MTLGLDRLKLRCVPVFVVRIAEHPDALTASARHHAATHDPVALPVAIRAPWIHQALGRFGMLTCFPVNDHCARSRHSTIATATAATWTASRRIARKS